MADPWDTGAHLSLILSHANKTWHKTGENMPQWICTFICFSSVSPVLSSWYLGMYCPKWCLKTPTAAEEQDREWNYPVSAELINILNVGHTHCLMCCVCHVPTKQLPQVAKLPESITAPKRAAIWKHIFIDNLGKSGIHLRKSHNSVRNEQFMHIIIKFIFISSYSYMWHNSVWEIMLIS